MDHGGGSLRVRFGEQARYLQLDEPGIGEELLSKGTGANARRSSGVIGFPAGISQQSSNGRDGVKQNETASFRQQSRALKGAEFLTRRAGSRNPIAIYVFRPDLQFVFSPWCPGGDG